MCYQIIPVGCADTTAMVLESLQLRLLYMCTCVCSKSQMFSFFQKDFCFLKQEFVKVYMSSVYFLLHSPSLPSHRWADPSSEEQRARVIYATLTSLKHDQHTHSSSAGLEVFVDAAHEHVAFDVSELTFDFLGAAR